MAVEANIDEGQFFIAEDKALKPITISDANGAAVDITGWTLSWMLKRKLTDADAAALLTKTTGAGVTLDTPASGLCSVAIAAADTATLDPATYYHELKRMDAGQEAVLFYGRCALQRGVHRT